MSGFGNISGFGAPASSSFGGAASAVPAAPFFGGTGGGFSNAPAAFPQQQHPQPQQLAFGGTAAANLPMNTGFGGVAATPIGFGSSQQQQQPGSSMMFGSSPNVSAGAHAQHSMFGQPSSISTFAPSTASSAGGGFGGFGAASSTGGLFGSNTSNTNNSTAPFGLSSASGGFGTAPTHASSFGGAPLNMNTPFGNFPSNQQTPSVHQPFGSSTTGDVAPTQTHTPYASITSTNPFASSHQQGVAQAQSMSFGQSSNVVVTSTATTQSGFGSGFGAGAGAVVASSAGRFGNSNISQHPFASASTTTTPPPPFGMSLSAYNYDDGMADDAPASNLPFGQPLPTNFNGSSSSSRYSSTPHTTTSNMGSRFGATAAVIPPESEGNEALSNLQARIAEKKKKLEQKAAAAATAASALRAGAAPFAPSSMAPPPRNAATPFAQPSLSVPTRSAAPLIIEASSLAPPRNAAASMEPSSSVAQRNAVRFSESTDTVTRSQLPADLRSQSAEVTAAQTALRNSGGRSGRENLENAVSLVGTCEHMCPDEELLRREREGDIQLLERPVPDGKLHPSSWTLRNTMVKRFRRSAADYKLDVPGWVRPPDVLERVCSYLEEWVMVRMDFVAYEQSCALSVSLEAPQGCL